MLDEALTPQQKLEAAQAESDVRALLALPEGRRAFFRLLDTSCNTFGASYSGDALATAYAEGRRSVGIALREELGRLAPQHYVQMLAEAFEARLLAQQEAARDSGEATTRGVT